MNITEAQTQFVRAARWNLAGSICYVALKLLFHTTLFYTLDPKIYGAMGYIFSYIFLLVNFASAPTLYTLSTFFNEYAVSQKRTRIIVGALYTVQLVLLVAGALRVWSVLHTPFPTVALCAGMLVISEGIRLSLRLCMHLIQKTCFVIAFELISMAGYMGLVALLSYLNHETTLSAIFGPFMLDSAIVLAVFIGMITQWYRSLPRTDSGDANYLSHRLLHRIATTVSVNSLSYATHSFLSGNALIVAYAPSLGFAGIAVPKFAAYTADALRVMVKSLVGYAGLPLLSRLKTESADMKRAAFRDISQRLFVILLPATLIIAFQVSKISTALYLVSMFFCHKVVEQLLYLYEKFYLLEERVAPIITVSCAESFLFAGVIFYALSLTTALTFLVAIRILSLAFLALHAWRTLGIRPSFMLTKTQMFGIVIFLLCVEGILRCCGW